MKDRVLVFLFFLQHPFAGIFSNWCSFSQEGEDIIVDTILENKKDVTYIDFGAHDPWRFSNTLKFYIRGGHGLNVDANLRAIKKFNRTRKRDVNVQAVISNERVQCNWYEFNDTALNTLDETAAQHCIDEGYKVLKKSVVETTPVMELLEREHFLDCPIDILDIDVEGIDELIIESIDWARVRPRLILTEKQYDSRQSGFAVNQTLDKNGYKLVASTTRTAIYQRFE